MLCKMLEVRALLLETYVHRTFWCATAHTVVHLINRLPASILNNVSPFESLLGQPPSYAHVHVFVSLCFIHLPLNERTKLSS